MILHYQELANWTPMEGLTIAQQKENILPTSRKIALIDSMENQNLKNDWLYQNAFSAYEVF